MKVFCLALVLLVGLAVCGPSTSLFLKKLRQRMDQIRFDQEDVEEAGETYSYTQRRDHFNTLDEAIFKQRYFINDTFYQKEGPVFFMLGQEGPSSPNDVSRGLPIYLAEKFGALVVELEHRYYGPGESVPVDNLTTPNMRWLSSSQALEDFAHFRIDFADLHPEYNMERDTKWIIFGCSYAGAMSSWLRMKYPHLFLSAIGGSGPVEAEVDFVQYDQTVTYSLNLNSEECHMQSQQAMADAGTMSQDSSNWPQLEAMFNTCTPITNPLDFVDTVYNPLAFSVQYNLAVTGYPRDGLCETMTNTSNTPLENLAMANANPKFGNAPGCLVIDIYNGPDGLLNISTSVEFRKWFWQTCSEFGYYQTAAEPPRNTLSTVINVTYFLDMCAKTFDDAFSDHQIRQNINNTNDRYGAKHPQPTNVLYPNGYEDPWSTLGIERILEPTDMPVLYRGEGHCAPFESPLDTDTPSVKEGRAIIEQWLRYLLPEHA